MLHITALYTNKKPVTERLYIWRSIVAATNDVNEFTSAASSTEFEDYRKTIKQGI